MKSILISGLLMMTSITHAAEAPPILPNLSITPGTTYSNVTKEDICKVGYTAKVRNVSERTKKTAAKNYGIDLSSGKFEIDHLVSLQLGGSNDVKNLWPQSYTTTPWNARVKDKLENKLHSMVCSGKMSLFQAQKVVSTNWIAGYCVLYKDKKQYCN